MISLVVIDMEQFSRGDNREVVRNCIQNINKFVSYIRKRYEHRIYWIHYDNIFGTQQTLKYLRFKTKLLFKCASKYDFHIRKYTFGIFDSPTNSETNTLRQMLENTFVILMGFDYDCCVRYSYENTQISQISSVIVSECVITGARSNGTIRDHHNYIKKTSKILGQRVLATSTLKKYLRKYELTKQLTMEALND